CGRGVGDDDLARCGADQTGDLCAGAARRADPVAVVPAADQPIAPLVRDDLRDTLPGGALQGAQGVAIEVDDVRREVEPLAKRTQRIVRVPAAHGGPLAGAARLHGIHAADSRFRAAGHCSALRRLPAEPKNASSTELGFYERAFSCWTVPKLPFCVCSKRTPVCPTRSSPTRSRCRRRPAGRACATSSSAASSRAIAPSWIPRNSDSRSTRSFTQPSIRRSTRS